MKVLLIDPPFYRFMGYYTRYFPVGLCYIAALLEKKGHNVKVYSPDINTKAYKIDYSRLDDVYGAYLKQLQNEKHEAWQELKRIILEYGPDIIGITAWTTFLASTFKTAELCKQTKTDAKIVIGGPHATLKPDEILKNSKHTDFVIRSEGEYVLLDLIDFLQGNKKKSEIPGISYKKNNRIIHNKERQFIENLDELPLPARHLLIFPGKYNPEDYGLMMTSRGCPYACSYCATAIWKRRVRYRSIDNIIKEIKHVMKRYKTRQFTFKDDSFTLDKARIKELCKRIIQEKLKINWDCNTRVNLIDKDILKLMKRAGCNSIKVGIESGSERILSLMNKQITKNQIRHAAELLRKSGIHWTGYFMMGLPTETKQEILETLKFMKEIKPDFASISTYEIFPGTSLFELGIKKEFVKNEQTLTEYYNRLPHLYYLRDANKRSDTLDNDEFEQIEEYMKEQFHNYNKNPRRLAKRVLSRKYLYLFNPLFALSDIKKLIGWV